MSAFDPAWLTLREPYDQAARDVGLTARFVAHVGDAPVLADLGCGTGANFRYLAPRIGGAQSWIGIDHDPRLLRAAIERTGIWARERGWSVAPDPGGLAIRAANFSASLRLRTQDLGRGLPDDLPAGAAITASALLDLASAAWLDALAGRCRDRSLLLALSFDGRLEFSPADEEGAEVLRRFLDHQRTDKGFGPALGPDAAAHLADRLRALGHEVDLAPSDWRLDATDAPLLGAKVEGMVAAAREIADDALLQRWAARRRDQLAAGELRLVVGHLDLLALPG